MISQLKPWEFAEKRLKDLILDADQHFFQISELLLEKDNGDDVYEDFMISFREHLACKEFTLDNIYSFWKALPAYLKVIFMYLGVSKKQSFSIHQHQALLEILVFLDHLREATNHNFNEIVLKASENNNPTTPEFVKIKRKHSFGGLLYRAKYEIHVI